MSYAPLPTDAQASVARELISSKRRKIAKAERQIKEHEAHIAKLRSEIVKINAEIDEHDSYLAPARRLPNETLGSIFTICATDPDVPVQVLRTIGSVCRKWRDVVKATPSAWTKIDIQRRKACSIPGYGPPPQGAPRPKLLNLKDVEEWVTRSKTCMKDVTLEWDDDDWSGSEDEAESEPESNKELTAIFQLLGSRASEIRSFKADGLYSRPGDLLDQNLPSLRVLEYRGELGDDKFVSKLALSYPALSCLSVSGLGRGKLDRVVPLQGRLQVLAIRRLAADDLYQILRAGHGFAGLRALSVLCLEASQSRADTGVISLPDLRTLSIGLHGTCPVLKTLHMPQLKSLALARNVYDNGKITKKQVADLLDFHTTDDLALRELRLSKMCLSDADLLQLLKRSPQLETLAVVDGKNSDKFMASLSSKQGRSTRWICPSLSRLCIMTDPSSKAEKFSVSKDAFGAFVTARLLANQTSTPRGSPPPVARLMDARLDEDDVVFSGILSAEWAWEHDDAADPHRRSVVHHEYSLDDVPRWWITTSRCQELL